MYDVIVIGGGIVGVATAARYLAERPGASVLLIEKERSYAVHQTGHNSGVIHAGVYYAPGSLKATLCKAGNSELTVFCRAHSIPVELCGKLIVATNAVEVERLNALTARSRQNELEVTPISKGELASLEPHISGLQALRVHATGIVDYKLVTRVMAEQFQAGGGEVRLGETVLDLRESNVVTVVTEKATLTTNLLVVCAGVQADRLARMSGVGDDFRVIPFRGEYYRLPDSKNDVVKHLIYPVPDPDLPFLGVHLTRMIGGYVTVGPNAVFGFHREGYPRFSFNVRDTADALSFPGFWPMAWRHLSFGAKEMANSVWRSRYLKECQKYCPELKVEDLTPYPAGIRAQAVMRDGTLVHDFLIRRTARTIHVCNAPSPAATSALPIAREIVSRALAN
jgi:L-2-hydroxyglutarate oxidase